MIIAAALALVAAAVAVLFFACNSGSGGVTPERPSQSVSYSLTPPTDGSLPEDHAALDNLGYVVGRLSAREYYHTDSQSTVTAQAFGVTVNQYVNGGKDYDGGVLISTTFSRGEGLGAPAPTAIQRFFGESRAVLRNSVSDDPADWNGSDTEWQDGEPTEIIEKDKYAERYGLWGTEFSDYVMTEDTVLSMTDPALGDDGIYTMRFELDPATSTYYYANQMVTMGGLSGSPTFSYVNVTLRFTADWSVTEMRVSERYTSSKGVIKADTSGETVITYSYDKADVDVSAYDEYFAKYENAAASGSGETERTAADYLAEGFGSVLVSERTAFDFEAEIAGSKISGRALLGMDGGSPTSVRLETGGLGVLADIAGGKAYLSYKDFLGSLALSDLSSLFGGSLDLGSLGGGFESAMNAATLERTDGGALVHMDLPLGDIAAAIDFRFAETDGGVTWTEISATLEFGGMPVKLRAVPGDADAPFGEINTSKAVDLMPAAEAALALSGGAELSFTYNDGFSVTGAATIGADGTLSGGVTVSAEGISPVTADFAFRGGEIFLSVGGVKVRAQAGEWADALLSLAGAELPSEIDLAGLVGSLLGSDLGSIIKGLTLTESGLALSLDGDALLSALVPDAGASLGDIRAAFDAQTGAFSVSALGAEISVRASRRAPSVPGDGYVAVSPDDVLGFADAAREIAASGGATFGVSGTAAIDGISFDVRIAGEALFDGSIALYAEIGAGSDALRIYYAGGKLVAECGGYGLTLSEGDLAAAGDAIGGLLGGSGSAASLLGRIDIASLLADIRLLGAEGGTLRLTADLSSLLGSGGIDAELFCSDGGVALRGSLNIAGIMLENVAAEAGAAGGFVAPDFTGVTMCDNALEFALEAYMRLAESEYVSVALSYDDGSLSARAAGEIALERTDGAIGLNVALDAVITSGGASYYAQARIVGDTAYVYFSLVGFEESAYFPECVNASAQPLRMKLSVSSLFEMSSEAMPLIMSLAGLDSEGLYYFDFVTELLGGAYETINSDIFGVKSAAEWIELIAGIIGESGDGESPALSVVPDAEEKTLTLTGGGLNVTLGTGITCSVAAPAVGEYADYDSLSALVGVLMDSVTTTGSDGVTEINGYYVLSGTAYGSLGSLELASIGLGASVYVHDDFSVTVNIRVEVSYFVGVFEGDTVLDMTVENGMVYMTRTQTSRGGALGGIVEEQLDKPIIKFREMTTDAFLADITNQMVFIFNFGSLVRDELGGSTGGSSSTSTADVGGILTSLAYSSAAEGSAEWTLGLGLSALTGGALSDASVTLSAEGGVLKSLDLETKLSVLTLGASLGYANPGADMESGHASDKTVNVAERVSAALGGLPDGFDGYKEGTAATLVYSVDGGEIGRQEIAYAADGSVMTSLALPDLEAYNGGYTYSWGALGAVGGDVTLEAVRTPNVYTVTLRSEYEIDGLDCSRIEGGYYVYEFDYTYGTTLALPVGAEHGSAYSLAYFTDGGDVVTEISGIQRDVTLTAVWEEIEYTVTYTALGETYAVMTYCYGDALVLPECDVPGYEFLGWLTDAEYVTGNMTVEASLSVTVTLASDFAADGMTDGGEAFVRGLTLTGTRAEDFALGVSLSGDGRTQFGWWHNESGAWSRVTSVAGLDGETVYAAWISDIAVTITEASKSWGTWTINGSWSGGFVGATSIEIAESAGVTVTAQAWLKLSKDGATDFDTLNSGNSVSADGGSFGKGSMTSANDLFGSAKYGGAKVAVTFSCGDLTLTLESTAWKAK